MTKTLKASVAAVALLAAASTAPKAMEFSRQTEWGEFCARGYLGPDYPCSGNDVEIGMDGEIVSGDAAKFSAFLLSLPVTDRVIDFQPNSPGGLMGEAYKMAALIARTGIDTKLYNGATCASSCFWLFAAGQHRWMSDSARVGVHSASDMQGAEAPDATLAAARLSHRLGIPDQIVGKMVETPPTQIAWLDRGDLRALHVDVVTIDHQGEHWTVHHTETDRSVSDP